MTMHLAKLARALERSGCTHVRIGRHLRATTPNGTTITISGSPSASNRPAVLADLRRAGLDITDTQLRKAIERTTK